MSNDTIIGEKIDQVEAMLVQYPEVECPLTHSFVPGFYVRTIFMPAGTMMTSKIHKTQHPYHVSKGKVNVIIGDGIEHIEAPYWGMTEPNTRRILYIVEDCEWTTFHATDKTTPEEVEDDIIEKHDNPLLSDEIKRKNHLNICHSSQLQLVLE